MASNTDKHKKDSDLIKTVTWIGIALNTGLVVIKIVGGLFGQSMALVADGIHSLADLSTDFVVLLGNYFGSKEPDKEHPYGHGRIETFSAAVVALVLLGVGAVMIYQSALEIARHKPVQPGIVVLVIALICAASKEWLYWITKKAAIKTHSAALYANAWDHRSDALSSIAVMLGVVSTRVGFAQGDHVAAIIVGLMIMLVAVRVLSDCAGELTETAIDKVTISRITEIIDANAEIKHWHKLRSRMVGREVFLDVHILVDPTLSVAAAHDIAEHLENSLEEQITRPVNIIVHIEPDTPAMRE